MLLYVAKDKRKSSYCPGSRACLEIIGHIQNPDIQIQNVNKLISDGIELPGWLNGSPILVNKNTGEIMRGTAAVEFLKKQINTHIHKTDKDTVDKTQQDTTEMEGILPDGLTFCEDMDNPLGIQAEEIDESKINDGKVTERDLEEYMRKRNESIRIPQVQ